MLTFFAERFPIVRTIRSRLSESPLVYRLARGAFWTISGTITARVLALMTSIVIARYLGKTNFGELGVVQSTLMMLGVLAVFGTGMTTAKLVAEHRENDPGMTGKIVSLSLVISLAAGTIMALVMLFMAPWLASRVLAAPHLAGLLRLGSGLLVAMAIQGAQTGILSGFESFRALARINIIVGLISFPCMVAGVLAGGLHGVIGVLIATTVLNCILNHRAISAEIARIGIPLDYAHCSSAFSLLMNFSIPALFAEIMVAPVNWICGAILVNQPNGYAEMGVYNAANQWRIALLYLPGMLGNIALPILSNLHRNENKNDYRRMLWLNVALNGGVTLAAAVVISLASPWIMRSYGTDFAQGHSVLFLLSFSAVLIAIGTVAGMAIISSGRIWYGTGFNLVWALFIVACSAILVPVHGAKGLALSSIISYAVQTLLQMYYLQSVLR